MFIGYSSAAGVTGITDGHVWGYNTVTNTWTQEQEASMPTISELSFTSRAKSPTTGATEILALGGYAAGSPVPTVEACFPANNRWAEEAAMPAAIAGASAVQLSNGLAQVVGGNTGGQVTNSNLLYSP